MSELNKFKPLIKSDFYEGSFPRCFGKVEYRFEKGLTRLATLVTNQQNKNSVTKKRSYRAREGNQCHIHQLPIKSIPQKVWTGMGGNRISSGKRRIRFIILTSPDSVTAKRGDTQELSAQIKALNEQKAEIESAIKSLSSSGVKEITEASDKAITGLKSLLAEMRVETKKLADLKAEAGKLEKELMYARYLTTGDQAVLKSFPKEVVIAFLDRASSYCRLNQLHPMVRVPDGFSRKYSSISSYTEAGLLDLITWAEVGVAGALQ